MLIAKKAAGYACRTLVRCKLDSQGIHDNADTKRGPMQYEGPPYSSPFPGKLQAHSQGQGSITENCASLSNCKLQHLSLTVTILGYSGYTYNIEDSSREILPEQTQEHTDLQSSECCHIHHQQLLSSSWERTVYCGYLELASFFCSSTLSTLILSFLNCSCSSFCFFSTPASCKHAPQQAQ